MLAEINWLATLVGAAAAFALGMLWFSPALFGRIWSTGTHNISPPDSAPVAAMVWQAVATLLMAIVIGWTATIDALIPAILVILAMAVMHFSMGLFSQKSQGAALVDAGYIVAMGVMMIAAQGIF